MNSAYTHTHTISRCVRSQDAELIFSKMFVCHVPMLRAMSGCVAYHAPNVWKYHDHWSLSLLLCIFKHYFFFHFLSLSFSFGFFFLSSNNRNVENIIIQFTTASNKCSHLSINKRQTNCKKNRDNIKKKDIRACERERETQYLQMFPLKTVDFPRNKFLHIFSLAFKHNKTELRSNCR